MSPGGRGLLGLFVEPPAGAASAPPRHRTRAGDQPAPAAARVARRPKRRSTSQGWSASSERARPAAVAILASPARVVGATAAVAAGLVRVRQTRCVVAGVLGATTPSAGSALATPASRRAAAQLRRSGRDAVAAGRIVWLAGDASCQIDADPSEARAPDDRRAVSLDAAGDAAREARRLSVPAALGFALARSAELDCVLALHDAIFVVREPGADQELTELALASLARLDRPVVAMRPLGRFAAALAMTGAHVPAATMRVVAGLPGTGP